MPEINFTSAGLCGMQAPVSWPAAARAIVSPPSVTASLADPSLPVKKEPEAKPRRHKALTKSEQLERVIKRLYRDKPIYRKFGGHVAMSRATLPAVRSP
eukprot:scaffold93465_cov53-Prasinocladus_malaysianus.AAC.1